jgi:hypothetical protein
VSTLLHAIVYMFLHNLLNVLVHIANKIGLQKKKFAVEAQVIVGSRGSQIEVRLSALRGSLSPISPVRFLVPISVSG